MFWRLPEDKTTSIAALLVAGESSLGDSFAEPRLLPYTLLDCESHASAPLSAGLAQARLLPRAFSDRARHVVAFFAVVDRTVVVSVWVE
jgi:hypothetical protein